MWDTAALYHVSQKNSVCQWFIGIFQSIISLRTKTKSVLKSVFQGGWYELFANTFSLKNSNMTSRTMPSLILISNQQDPDIGINNQADASVCDSLRPDRNCISIWRLPGLRSFSFYYANREAVPVRNFCWKKWVSE